MERRREVVWKKVGEVVKAIGILKGGVFVVAMLEHFGGVASGEGVAAGAKIDVHGVGAPVAEEFDGVFVDVGTQEAGGATRPQRAGVYFERRDAGVREASGSGASEGSGEVAGVDG